MTADLHLAIAHHLLFLLLAGVLAFEIGVVRSNMDREDILRVARVDIWYGALAGAIILVGFLRAIFAAKGWAYYSVNLFFWAKVGAFAVVGVLSIMPTTEFIRWRKATSVTLTIPRSNITSADSASLVVPALGETIALDLPASAFHADDPCAPEAPQVPRHEWLADAQFAATHDFVELYNPDPAPVSLGGLFLSDAAGAPARNQIAALSFIGANGLTSFIADGDAGQGPNHLNFKLSPDVGTIILSGPDLQPIDVITYGPQQTDVSQGRSPSGGITITSFAQPTDGGPNPGARGGASFVTDRRRRRAQDRRRVAPAHARRIHRPGAPQKNSIENIRKGLPQPLCFFQYLCIFDSQTISQHAKDLPALHLAASRSDHPSPTPSRRHLR